MKQRGDRSLMLFVTRICLVVFVLIVAALHVLRPDVDPVTHGISRYQWGPYGMVMSIGFVLLAIALLSTAHLLQRRQRVNKVSFRLLHVSAFGSLLVAGFPLSESPPLIQAVAHQLGGFVLFAMAALAIWMTAANIGGIAARQLGRLTAAMAVLFFLAIVLKMPVVGLLQRCVVASVCVWIATVTTTMGRYEQSPDVQSVT